MERPRERTAVSEREPSPSSEGWARRLQRGDTAAVQQVRDRIRRILSYRSLDFCSPERADLEQEVMIEIWQGVNREGFDPSAGFWGFVEVVTSRRCIDWLRSRRERVALPEGLVDPGAGPLRNAQERERGDLASATLASLDSPCRELLELRFRDDLSYREIARRTGKTEGALRVQLYRCVQQARSLVEQIAGGSEPTRIEGRS